MLLVSLCMRIGAQWQGEVQGLILDLCIGTRLKLRHRGMAGLQQEEHVSCLNPVWLHFKTSYSILSVFSCHQSCCSA